MKVYSFKVIIEGKGINYPLIEGIGNIFLYVEEDKQLYVKHRKKRAING
jgi:hypothetical protein